jgi:hypothetical protein
VSDGASVFESRLFSPPCGNWFFPSLDSKYLAYMRIVCWLIGTWLSLGLAQAQVMAFTTTGDTIIVMPDGTLAERRRSVNEGRSNNFTQINISQRTGAIRDSFEEDRSPRTMRSNGSLPTSPIPYTRPAEANLYLKGATDQYRVWFDVGQWIPQPLDPATPQTEMVFSLRQGRALAMMIFEPTEVPLPSLVEATIDNLKGLADNVRLVAQEYRDVNDRFVLCVRIDGSLRDESFTYYNYYYTGEGYTVQFTLYAPREVFLRQQPTIRDLMNGLVVK